MMVRYGFRCTDKKQDISYRNEKIKPFIGTYPVTKKKS
jgi:hypothetical protein